MISLVMKNVSSSPLVGTVGSLKYSRSDFARLFFSSAPSARPDSKTFHPNPS